MRVLVVDDSVVYRTAIKTTLEQSSDVDFVKVASNGKIALDLIEQSHYDAITLDLEMPVMDGVETLKAIRVKDKEIPIIIFSAQNLKSANKTLTALEMGASDFVQKIEGSDLNENLKMIRSELIPKFKVFIDKVKRRHLKTQLEVSGVTKPAIFNAKNFPKPDLICIGSSTGGPDALKSIFKGLKPQIDIPILLVQHMPPVFTTQLASTLDKICNLHVQEARDGDILEAGHCYLAPGNFHMTLENENSRYVIRLNQNPKVCYVRPSVDVLFNSVAKNFKGNVASIILTGMGVDGSSGCQTLKAMDKGPIIIQDESSSAVFGMPKAVYELGIYDEITDISGIYTIINELT